nr:MAG: RNA dependent RNA polymerase [Picornaviridae sp.]
MENTAFAPGAATHVPVCAEAVPQLVPDFDDYVDGQCPCLRLSVKTGTCLLEDEFCRKQGDLFLANGPRTNTEIDGLAVDSVSAGLVGDAYMAALLDSEDESKHCHSMAVLPWQAGYRFTDPALCCPFYRDWVVDQGIPLFIRQGADHAFSRAVEFSTPSYVTAMSYAYWSIIAYQSTEFLARFDDFDRGFVFKRALYHAARCVEKHAIVVLRQGEASIPYKCLRKYRKRFRRDVNRGRFLEDVKNQHFVSQSGQAIASSSRAMREVKHREAAAKKRKAERPSKIERELDKKESQRRNAQRVASHMLGEDDFVAQSGHADLIATVLKTVAGLSVAWSAKRALDSVPHAFHSASKSVEKAADSAAGAFGSAGDVMEQIRRMLGDAVNKLKSCFLSKLWYIPAACLAIWLFTSTDNLFVRAGLIGLFAASLGHTLWSIIGGFFQTPSDAEEFVAQAGFDPTSLVQKVLAAVAGYVVYGNAKSGASKMMGLLKLASMWKSASGTIESFSEWVVSIIEHVINFVRNLLHMNKVSIRSNLKQPFYDLCTLVNKLEREYQTGERQVGSEFCDELLKATQLVYGFDEAFRGTANEAAVRDLKRRVGNLLVPNAAAISSRNNMRPEPVFVLMRGGTGIGKSAMTLPMTVAMLVRSGLVSADLPTEEVLKHVIAMGNSQYWNGYCNQMAFIMDDFGQAIPSEMDKENDYLSIIRMIGSWSMPLNMADLASKGRVFFNSRLVLGTTNLRDLGGPNSMASRVVTHPEAVARRVSVGFELYVKPEYRMDPRDENSRLDLTKFAAEFERCSADPGAPAYPWYIWRAKRYCFLKMSTEGDYIDLESIIDEVAAKIKVSADVYGRQRQAVENIVLSERRNGAAPEVEGVDPDFVAQSGGPSVAAHRKELADFKDGGVDPLTFSQSLYYTGGHMREQDGKVIACAFLRHSSVRDYFSTPTPYAYFSSLKMLASDEKFPTQLVVDKLGEYITELSCKPTLDSLKNMQKVIHAFHSSFPDHAKKHVKAHIKMWRKAFSQWHRQMVFAGERMHRLWWRCKDDQEEVRRIGDHNFYEYTAVDDVVDILELAGLMVLQAAVCFIAVRLLIKGIFYALDGIKRMLLPAKQEEFVPESNHVPKSRVVTGGGGRRLVAQSRNVHVHNNIIRDTYLLSVVGRNTGHVFTVGHVLFVAGSYALMPRHFSVAIRDAMTAHGYDMEDHVVLTNIMSRASKHKMTIGDFTRLSVCEDQDNDICLRDFTGMRAHKNKISKFISEKSLGCYGGALASMVTSRSEQETVGPDCTLVKEFGNLQLGLRRDKSYATPNGHVSKCARTWVYSANTQYGDCGVPIMLNDNDQQQGCRTIVGVHVAGTNTGTGSACSLGLAVVVTQEMVEGMMSALQTLGCSAPVEDDMEEDLKLVAQGGVPGMQCKEAEHFRYEPVEALDFFPDGQSGSFLPLYRINMGLSISPYTKLQKTPYGQEEVFGESPVAPAVMKPFKRDGEVIVPMLKAYAKYNTDVEIFTDPDIDLALDVAMKPFFDATVNRRRDILTYEEAVIGNPDWGFSGIPRQTSVGWPYNKIYPKGKAEIWGEGEQPDFSLPGAKLIRARTDYILEKAQAGIRLLNPFSDFLKDETLPLHKVRDGATRLISGAPLPYFIAWRQYFGSIQQAQLQTWAESGFCPGICVYRDWGILTDKLRSKGDKCFDGDFKGFDASEQPSLLLRILDKINDWYDDGPHNAVVRRVLFEDLVHSRHIGGNGYDQSYLYQWQKSLPSGHPATSFINSIFSMLVLVYSYIKEGHEPWSFWDEVSAATLGDDNICNVSDRVAETFNQQSVAHHAAKLGCTYTSAQKDGVLVKYKPLCECTFLKRTFHVQGGLWVGALDPASFLYTVYYTRATTHHEVEEYLKNELQRSIEELSLHDVYVWERYIGTFTELMASLGISPKHGANKVRTMRAVVGRSPFYMVEPVQTVVSSCLA